VYAHHRPPTETYTLSLHDALPILFVPMAFFPGSTGVIYQQFSVTIVSAMTLSVLVALIFTPALCANLLKPIPKGQHQAKRGFFRSEEHTSELQLRENLVCRLLLEK